MASKEGVIVCGMHGKTTTSAMAAHVLRAGGLKPSHYVGAEIPILGTNARWDSEGSLFVAEGDESDGTLANYHPRHAIVLNIEPEHLDHYANLAAIDAAFARLLDQTAGKIFYCADDLGAVRVCAKRPNAVSYGKTGTYSCADIRSSGFASTFSFRRGDKELARVTLNVPGEHNVVNATAVLALAGAVACFFLMRRYRLEETVVPDTQG